MINKVTSIWVNRVTSLLYILSQQIIDFSPKKSQKTLVITLTTSSSSTSLAMQITTIHYTGEKLQWIFFTHKKYL